MQTVERQQRRWTAEEFYQLLDLGFFQDQRVELIDGEILEMASQKNFHLAGITLSADAFRIAFGPGYWVREQGSLDLSPLSIPDPDIAVVPGTARQASTKNPTSALLITEVSDTTLSYDRGRKACLYAAAGISDYWIINLVQRQLEVYRNPVPDNSSHFGWRYADMVILGPNDFVSPLAAPHAQIAVADLLP
jgi:Uma2 family endonuclease